MSRIRTLMFGGVTALAVAGAAFGALAIPTAPAHAQEWFGVHIGPFGFGFGEPYYSPYYYTPYYSQYYHYNYPYGYQWGYPY
ncbi:MAG: hypothetical protein ACREE1_02000 [Stellaceae bacterium]